MNATIGIKQEYLVQISRILSHILADEYILYTKTLNAHWNVEGTDFYSFYLLFGSQSEDLVDITNKIAERIRKLGHYAIASLKQFLELTKLTEQHWKKNNGAGFIRELLSDHERIILHIKSHLNNINNELKEAGILNFLTGLAEHHEKTAWILRSHLK